MPPSPAGVYRVPIGRAAHREADAASCAFFIRASFRKPNPPPCAFVIKKRSFLFIRTHTKSTPVLRCEFAPEKETIFRCRFSPEIIVVLAR